MNMRIFHAGLLLIGMISAGLLIYSLIPTSEHGLPRLYVENPRIVLSPTTIGTNLTVEYTVVNEGPGPAILVGGESGCFDNCCFSPIIKDASIVSAGSQITVKYELLILDRELPFTAQVKLFFDASGTIIKLEIGVSSQADDESTPK